VLRKTSVFARAEGMSMLWISAQKVNVFDTCIFILGKNSHCRGKRNFYNSWPKLKLIFGKYFPVTG
jgi:hypothetical protein